MKKRYIIITSVCAGALVIAGAALGIIFGVKANNENKEELYQLGVKHLLDREYEEASEIFGSGKLRNYKDTSKKYSYSLNLQRYEQHHYTYENLIDYGLSESGSVAVVDFDTVGGEEIARKTINQKQEGKYITEVAVKEHYDFSFWMLTYASYELSTDSIRYVLESKYGDHAYTISYELDGGSTTETLPKKFYYGYGDIVIPNLTKVGYDFVGYGSNISTGIIKDFVIPNKTEIDVNLIAKFEPRSYTVTLNANGGSVDPTVVSDVYFGEDVTHLFPTPTKSYYTFSHWTYNDEVVDLTNWSIPDNVELIAQYTPIKYSISYNLNGARYLGLPTKYDCLTQIDLPYVEKKDALFMGWKKYGDVMDENPNYHIGYGTHGDLRFDAIFIDATIDEDGILQDISDKTIKRFVIPSYVTDINPELVYQMPNLLNIFADAKNKHFSMSERLLVKDNHIACAYPVTFNSSIMNLPDSITEIGVNAFRGTEFATINGSALVNKIGASAFRDCSKLEVCNIVHVNYVGNRAFENTKVSEGFLDDNKNSLSHIGDYAFKGSKVSKVDIGSTVQHIGQGAFANLSGFDTVNFYPNLNCEFGDNLFKDCSGIKTLNTDVKFLEKLMASSFNSTNLTTINLKGSSVLKADALANKTTLKTVDMSETSLTDVPTNAFKGDSSLESVTLPSSLRRIQAGAFEDCEKLSSVNFNDLTSLIRIESGAFIGNDFEALDFRSNPYLTLSDNAFTSSSKLTSIKLKHGQITTRMADVFSLCGKISEVVYEIPEIGDESVILADFLFEDLNNVENITINYLGPSNKLIMFGNGAFKNCATLKNVTLTNCHVNYIPNYCFEGCVSLTNNNEVFSNLDTYGEGAFYGCSNLSKMSFTNTNVIGKNAFAGCFKLTSLEIAHNDNLIIGQAAFAELCGVITLHYTEAEVNNLKKLTGKWYGFDQGFSGILDCIGS